jgi:hypothetical protein
MFFNPYNVYGLKKKSLQFEIQESSTGPIPLPTTPAKPQVLAPYLHGDPVPSSPSVHNHLLAYAHGFMFIFFAGPLGLISKSKISMGTPIVVHAFGI